MFGGLYSINKVGGRGAFRFMPLNESNLAISVEGKCFRVISSSGFEIGICTLYDMSRLNDCIRAISYQSRNLSFSSKRSFSINFEGKCCGKFERHRASTLESLRADESKCSGAHELERHGGGNSESSESSDSYDCCLPWLVSR